MAQIDRQGLADPFSNWLVKPLLPDLQRTMARAADWELVGYGCLVAVAFVLRIWDVGMRAMHHDESLHATYAWYLFQGRGYQYNPLMHGPLQFYVIAFFYMLFGDTETTARLFAVLCGTGLVGLPFFLQREMGRAGALIAAVALTISPAFLYYSRFVRDDVYLDFFTLALVVCICAYVRERRPRYVYLGAACAALAMATMEAAYIVFFIFGMFLLLLLVRERLMPRMIGAMHSSAVPTAAESTRPHTPMPPHQPPVSPRRERVVTDMLRSVPMDVWIYTVAIFVVITILLYSTFLTNPEGVFDPNHGLMSASRTDIWGGITYWLSQHGVARGGQPWYYYLLLFPLYEQFAVIFAVGGAVWAGIRGQLFTRFLAFWFILALAIYSWAGEKMPWLLLHPLLPALLLAGSFAGHLLSRAHRLGRTVIIAVLAVLLLAEAHSAQALSYADGANPTEMLIYVQTSNDVPLVAGEVTTLVHRIRSKSPAPLVQVDDADLQGWPFEWYFRNLPSIDVDYSSNFADATAPILIMLGPEHDLYNSKLQSRYVVSQYRWNWWFPEDYKGFTFDNGMCGTATREIACASGQTGMVFLKTGTPCPPTQTVATNCSLIQTPAAINLFDAVLNGSTWTHLWNWFVYRTPFGQRGSRMLYLYVRKDLVPKGFGTLPSNSNGGTGSQSGPYRTLPVRRINEFGNSGTPAHRVLDPSGLAVGPRGDVYVADSGNHRVDVFSPSGRLLRNFGAPGTGPGQFNVNQSPMGVAVSKTGTAYVADWWGHRIEEFSPTGRFVRSWGHFGSHGPFGFYGPRAVAIGSNGNVYVADTGNRQIAVFSPSGRFRFRFGIAGSAPGQFEEPSSVVAAKNGDIYVADMWNSRIQRFDAAGHFLGSWAVPSWQTNSYEEPYLAPLANGDLLATDPESDGVLEFSRSGRPKGAITVNRLNLPIGVAAAPDGAFYVSDSAGNNILKLRFIRHRAGPAGRSHRRRSGR